MNRLGSPKEQIGLLLELNENQIDATMYSKNIRIIISYHMYLCLARDLVNLYPIFPTLTGSIPNLEIEIWHVWNHMYVFQKISKSRYNFSNLTLQFRFVCFCRITFVFFVLRHTEYVLLCHWTKLFELFQKIMLVYLASTRSAPLFDCDNGRYKLSDSKAKLPLGCFDSFSVSAITAR